MSEKGRIVSIRCPSGSTKVGVLTGVTKIVCQYMDSTGATYYADPACLHTPTRDQVEGLVDSLNDVTEKLTAVMADLSSANDVEFKK